MGCDIHCYIEYKAKDSNRWRGFGGRINPGRNYSLFTKLAGVRDYSGGKIAFIPPRGMPEDAAWDSSSDNQLFISESEGDGNATKENAERWVASGYSKYVNDSSGNRKRVTHPDWHSHSWLTADEWSVALGDPDHFAEMNEPEYIAILAALRSFEGQGFQARVVFWFDN